MREFSDADLESALAWQECGLEWALVLKAMFEHRGCDLVLQRRVHLAVVGQVQTVCDQPPIFKVCGFVIVVPGGDEAEVERAVDQGQGQYPDQERASGVHRSGMRRAQVARP
jgi:hypothetical protein